MPMRHKQYGKHRTASLPKVVCQKYEFELRDEIFIIIICYVLNEVLN